MTKSNRRMAIPKGGKIMSSDDGIYVGRFVSEIGEGTWRVAETGAIDNTTDGSEEDNDIYIALIYSKSPVFLNSCDAWKWARMLERQYSETEYGCVGIDYDIPFPVMSYKEAIVKHALLYHRR